jgi:hypothetical protein
VIERLDARDLVPPFTTGALRGGSHVHVVSPDGRLVSFTYEDAVLDAAPETGPGRAVPREKNLRGVGVSVCGKPVPVPRTHARNHDGTAFSVLVTRLTDEPTPGSDEISKAFEEAWIGTNGYVRADGSRQRRAIAFQGNVVTATGATISEVFILDLPGDLAALCVAGDRPIAGTAVTRPAPPHGVTQRRLTFTADRRHPGLQGPRHWLRSSPDGARIALLMRDDAGIVQLFTVSPAGGVPRQVTHDAVGIASAFSWSPDSERLACVIDGSVCLAPGSDHLGNDKHVFCRVNLDLDARRLGRFLVQVGQRGYNVVGHFCSLGLALERHCNEGRHRSLLDGLGAVRGQVLHGSGAVGLELVVIEG